MLLREEEHKKTPKNLGVLKLIQKKKFYFSTVILTGTTNI